MPELYQIIAISPFEKQLKRLIKKYPSLKNEFIGLLKELKIEPKLGTPLGNNCYKIRIAISSKGKGKSGGARVITYLTVTESKISLLSMYDKSEKENIEDKDLLRLLEYVK